MFIWVFHILLNPLENIDIWLAHDDKSHFLAELISHEKLL